MVYCSPTTKYNKHINTCFSDSDILNIVNAYNDWGERVCNENTCLKKIVKKIDTTLDIKEMYKQLKNILNVICKNDYCWLEMDFLEKLPKETRENLKYFTFKPKQPKTSHSLFNTVHINEVLQQYQAFINEKKDKMFKFLGAVPADIIRIEKIDLELLKNYTSIGIIFNTDKHTKPGTHWVACFIDNKKKEIDYFDSLGKYPNKYIKEFLYKFKDYEYKIRVNTKAHQKYGVNCGAYAVYFIISRLKGISFNEINKYDITDNMMNFYRKNIFRPYW